ncbi:MAG: hypothetical protein ABIK32_02630 [Chloroflexota bacterium]|nr:hypothetical protein [Chloroflexota bacterium]
MKISKKSWFTIVFGFLIMAAVSLSFVYYQGAGEREHLQADLLLARSKLSSVDTSTLTYQQEKLEGDLNQAYKEYEVDKEKFAQSIENIDVSNILYSTANVNSVNIIEMSSSDVSSEVIEGASCLALTVDVKVVGDVDNLVAFITQLNDDLPNGVVRSVNIGIPYPAGDSKPSVSIQVVIYTYKES